MKNSFKNTANAKHLEERQKQWQSWPLEHRHSDWLDKHTGALLGFLLIAGAVFSFICGVVVELVQPPLYSWVMRLLELG